MGVIHKKCGTELVSSGKGDSGYCPKCKKIVHHLAFNGLMKDGAPDVDFSEDVIIY